MTKLEFASPEWFAALRDAMQACLERTGDEAAATTFSMSERYLDPPARLSPAGAPIGFTARFDSGKLLFETTITEDVDVMIEAPYDVLLPRARAVFSDDPEKWRRSFDVLVLEGTIVVKGDWASRPTWLGIHDEIAAITA